MSGLAGRLCSLFVTPAPARSPAEPLPSANSTRTVAILCTRGDALALGSACALELARVCASEYAVACLWRGPDAAAPAWRVPAFPAASRAAEAMTARGLRADASGRLVRVSLPEPATEAAAAAQRAIAAARAPVAVAVAEPRCAAIDRVIVAADQVVLACGGVDPALVRLAETALAGIDVPAIVSSVSLGPAARALASVGVFARPGLGLAALGRVAA